MDFASRSIGLKGVINARELGGTVLPGGTVRRGLLLRGGALTDATDDDIARLTDVYHVSKVFDFRTSMEVKHSPDREIPGAVNIWLPAFNEKSQRLSEMSLPHEAYSDLGNWLTTRACQPKVQEVARALYNLMVEEDFTRMQYAGFLQNILQTTDGAVYWHCSQGKDRTGLGAALLLAALGADRKTIMEDYLISNEFYKEEVDYYCSLVGTEEEREVMRTFIGVNPVYFSYALDLVEAECGSLMGFLQGPLCLSDSDVRELRDRYIQR